MHLPLLNTITGRSLCCVSRALPTRRIFGRTLVLGRPKSWSDAPPSPSSGLHQISAERSSWRDSVCRCSFVKPGASADCRSTVTDGTEQHAPTQAGCALEPRHQNAHSPECAGRPVDMNIAVPADDARAVEVLASGLPLFHGAQLAVDITLRSALTATGLPRPGAAVVDGIVCMAARADKERKYSELLNGDRCRLVVVALETGARSCRFHLAMARARDAPPNLQRSAFLSWRRRWTRMIAISCGRSFANSLVAQSSHPHALASVDGGVPHLAEVLSEE